MNDDEWAFVASHLAVMAEAAPQREHPPLREVFNGLRWIARANAPWQMHLQASSR